jgi:hypothetical protein
VSSCASWTSVVLTGADDLALDRGQRHDQREDEERDGGTEPERLVVESLGEGQSSPLLESHPASVSLREERLQARVNQWLAGLLAAGELVRHDQDGDLAARPHSPDPARRGSPARPSPVA